MIDKIIFVGDLYDQARSIVGQLALHMGTVELWVSETYVNEKSKYIKGKIPILDFLNTKNFDKMLHNITSEYSKWLHEAYKLKELTDNEKN